MRGSTARCITRAAVPRHWSSSAVSPGFSTGCSSFATIACHRRWRGRCARRERRTSRSRLAPMRRGCSTFFRSVAGLTAPQYGNPIVDPDGRRKMAGEQRPSRPPGGKRRPPPTTLDLKATEVAPDPVKPAETTDSDQKTASAEASEAAAAAAPNAENASPPTWRPNWVEARMARIGARLSAGSSARLIAASAAAAAAMLVLFLALWGLGAFTTLADALPARIAALETQVRALAAKPAPASADPRALAELAARVAKAEQAA